MSLKPLCPRAARARFFENQTNEFWVPPPFNKKLPARGPLEHFPSLHSGFEPQVLDFSAKILLKSARILADFTGF